MLDLSLNGAQVVTSDGVRVACVGIHDGVIHSVTDMPLPAHRSLDARGKLLLPGVVDLHVHFSEPGRGHWEGWASGSRAAAAGGVTTVVEMPLNAIPATINVAALQLKLAAAQAKSVVDFALWGGLMQDNRTDLADLYAAGVMGFKAFMFEINEGPAEGSFRYAPDHILYTGMRELARLGARLAVHAENSGLIHGLARELQAQGQQDPRAWLEAHPPISELEAVQRALLFAWDTGCRLHVVHVSLPEAARAILAARAQGQDVTYEVCAHHLTLTDADFLRLGAVAKCAPPLRDAARVEALWEQVLAGEVDCITSDHSPCPTVDKTVENIWDAWGGINGIQLTLPLMLDEGARRGLPLAQLARLLSERPAQLAGLGDRKGAIRVGLDADLVLVDPAAPWTLSREDLKSLHPWSPYLGRQFQHKVERVYRRGEPIYVDGQVTAGTGGEWLKPARPGHALGELRELPVTSR